MLVSLVTFILYVFSYVPLHVIYLYIYTYVHTLSLRITSLFFLCFPCSVIVFCLCLCLFCLYIYIYISSFDLILAHPTCISSVLLSLTSFRFSYVANYVLPVFEHNLAYSTHLYISPSLLNSNRLSIVFFCFFILSFSYFSRSIIFVFSFFFSLCICLSCLSIYLRIVCHF